jgi:hypothetical protein
MNPLNGIIDYLLWLLETLSEILTYALARLGLD